MAKLCNFVRGNGKMFSLTMTIQTNTKTNVLKILNLRFLFSVLKLTELMTSSDDATSDAVTSPSLFGKFPVFLASKCSSTSLSVALREFLFSFLFFSDIFLCHYFQNQENLSFQNRLDRTCIRYTIIHRYTK